MNLNIGQGQTHESHFGPPSEPINVSQFILYAVECEQGTSELPSFQVFSTASASLAGSAKDQWERLPATQQSLVAAECSLNDIDDSLSSVISSPRLMGYVMSNHDAFIHSIYESADVSHRRKRKRPTIVEPTDEHPDVTALRGKMDSIQLQSWQLTLNAAMFIRSPKQCDHNALFVTKQLCQGGPGTSSTNVALLFITVYSPLAWGHRLLSRTSQHVLLSSQTLGDMFEAIPCTSNELPKEQKDVDGVFAGYELGNAAQGDSSGCVICVEGIAYGDAQMDNDYAVKFKSLLETNPGPNRPVYEPGAAMHDTTLSSLTVRLYQPYWMVHAGNCEHYFVIEQIRLHHPADPPVSAYPLTTQITPPLLDACRACNKAPAVYSIIGDLRLGESPFVICAPCWRWMGQPKDQNVDEVKVVPLPKYEIGWG